MLTSGYDPTEVLIAGLVDCSLNTPKESRESRGLMRRAPLVGISSFGADPKTMFPSNLAFGAAPPKVRIAPESDWMMLLEKTRAVAPKPPVLPGIMTLRLLLIRV